MTAGAHLFCCGGKSETQPSLIPVIFTVITLGSPRRIFTSLLSFWDACVFSWPAGRGLFNWSARGCRGCKREVHRGCVVVALLPAEMLCFFFLFFLLSERVVIVLQALTLKMFPSSTCVYLLTPVKWTEKNTCFFLQTIDCLQVANHRNKTNQKKQILITSHTFI